MKLSNYLYLLGYITMINAQDDNPKGHEVGLPHVSLHVNSISTSTSTSSTLDDNRSTSISTATSTSTSVFDDSAFKASSGDENVLKYGLLLWGFLVL